MLESARFPSLTAISAFEAAARHGSFAGAARELGTTSASVSYHVRRLEAAIDVRLFRRFAHRVELTPCGSEIAEETIAAFGMLRASFARGAAIDDAQLSISALPTFGTSWLTPRLGRFRDRHPGMRLTLDLWPEPRDLVGGGYDAAIRNGHGRWPGLRVTYLFPSIFLPLCAPGLAEAARDLTAVPMLGRPDWWELWFRAAALDMPREFGIDLAEEHLDAAAAIAGHGVTIGSPILFRHEIEAGRLVPAHDLVVGDGRSFWLVYPAGRRHSSKIARFQQWLEEEAEVERLASAAFIARAVIVEP